MTQDGSDEEEVARLPSYRKMEDKKTTNALAALLMFDDDRLTLLVGDDTKITNIGVIARVRMQISAQFGDRILADESHLAALIQAKFSGETRPGFFNLLNLRDKKFPARDARDAHLRDNFAISRAIGAFFQILALICDPSKVSDAARFWLALPLDFQTLLQNPTVGEGINDWDPKFVLDRMVRQAMEDTCTNLLSAFQDNKPVGAEGLQDVISAVWGRLTLKDWFVAHHAFEAKK